MRFPVVRGWLVLFGAFLLLSCETASVKNSATLIDLDKEWVSLYEKKLAAQPGSGATINDQLAQLSKRAEQSGDATSDTDPATAAGFYRIAATTAWTAGPPRNAQLVTLRDKGNTVCAKVTPDEAAQPRDCAFVRVAPGLAALDQRVAEAKAFLEAGSTLDGANLTKAKDLADGTTKSIQRVLQDRPAPASQSKSFDDYIELNLNRAYCTLRSLGGRPSSSSDETLQPLLNSVTAAQQALRDANVSTQC